VHDEDDCDDLHLGVERWPFRGCSDPVCAQIVALSPGPYFEAGIHSSCY
jgi:hypothetical protein